MSSILPFLKAKVVLPPLGLLTVAAMLPREWNLKVVDLNVMDLEDEHLAWADMMMISAMTIQRESADEVVRRCNEAGVRVVAGGPHYMHFYKLYAKPNNDACGVDHYFVSEAEDLIPEFVEDMRKGTPKPAYIATEFPDITKSPPPRLDLVDLSDYYNMGIQISRGCPFNCEFCDVIALFGRKPRYKTVEQCLAELDNIHKTGWRGGIMFVDDNFIGNKKLARDLLIGIGKWQREHGFPFFFYTQASINLSDDDEMMRLMGEAMFMQVFLGIETPSAEALKECAKKQNQGRDLVASVHRIQANGMDVMAGFIVGFDSDTEEIFETQKRFIEESAIPLAMVNLLSAAPETPLWARLEREGRLLGPPSGNSALDIYALNFVPSMDRTTLLTKYRELMVDLYSPKSSYGRVMKMLDHYRIPEWYPSRKPTPREAKALLALFWHLGVLRQGRLPFWKLFLHTLFTRPKFIPTAMNLAAMVHNVQNVTRDFNPDELMESC